MSEAAFGTMRRSLRVPTVRACRGHATSPAARPRSLSTAIPLLAALAALGAASHADERGEQSRPTDDETTRSHIQIVDGLLSVHARDVPLRELVEEIALHYGVSYVLHDPLPERVSLQFEELTLPQALERLLRRKSFALQYAQLSPDADSTSGHNLSKLWVFSQGPADSAPPIKSPEAAASARRASAPSDPVPVGLALSDPDPTARLAAVAALTETEATPEIAALAVALSDEDSAVRYEAVYALGELRGDPSVQLLREALADVDAGVREAAVEAFTEIGGEAATQALSLALNHPDPSLREAAASALGDIGGETAMGLLRRAAADPELIVREAAADALADLGD